MSHPHDLDKAVLLSRRAISLQHLRGVEPLTNLLYHHWYLGLGDRALTPRRGSGAVWQSWSPDWTACAHEHDAYLRVFVACAPGTPLHALAVLTRLAQSWHGPWHLRSTALDMAQPTADSTSLTFPLAFAQSRRRDLDRLVTDLAPFVITQTPAMTLKLGRGVAAGQLLPSASGLSGSFGRQRCRIIAVSALDSRQHHHREQLARTMLALKAAGIDPQQPFRLLHPAWDRGWGSGRVSA